MQITLLALHKATNLKFWFQYISALYGTIMLKDKNQAHSSECNPTCKGLNLLHVCFQRFRVRVTML